MFWLLYSRLVKIYQIGINSFMTVSPFQTSCPSIKYHFFVSRKGVRRYIYMDLIYQRIAFARALKWENNTSKVEVAILTALLKILKVKGRVTFWCSVDTNKRGGFRRCGQAVPLLFFIHLFIYLWRTLMSNTGSPIQNFLISCSVARLLNFLGPPQL